MSISGPNYASTATDLGDSVVAWTNASNALTDDGSFASSNSDAGVPSNTLEWTGFGFSIPSGVSIAGITVEIRSRYHSTNGADSSVKLVKSGTIVGSNKAINSGFAANVWATQTYGGSSDLWGTTWSYSDINASNFGLAFQSGDAGSPDPEFVDIDFARITVTYSSPQTVSPSGIASSEAFGSSTVSNLNTVSPSGIASSEAFGSPTVTPGAVSISPTGISSAEAFGTASISPGPVSIAPTGITTGEAFGNATVGGLNTISPTGIASGEAFGVPVMVYDQTVTPVGIASGEAFGVPSVGSMIFPTGIASSEAFGSPTITPGVATISPTGIASAEAFGTTQILPGPVTITPSGIASSEAVGSPTVARIPVFSRPITIVTSSFTEPLSGFLLPVKFNIDAGDYTSEMLFVDSDGNILPSHLISTAGNRVQALVKVDLDPAQELVIFAHYR